MAKLFRRRRLAQRTVALERFRLLPVLREPGRAIRRSGINALHWELRKLHHYSDRQPYQATANNSQPSRFGMTGNCLACGLCSMGICGLRIAITVTVLDCTP
jgi:hypothetical protein